MCIDSQWVKTSRESNWVALAWSDSLLLILDLTRKEPLRQTYVDTALRQTYVDTVRASQTLSYTQFNTDVEPESESLSNTTRR